MRLLLDTCCLLWLSGDPARLPTRVADAFKNPANEIYLSASSAWEIAIKYKAGRLDLASSPERYIAECQTLYDIVNLDIGLPHVLTAGALPLHHHDPFDRLLIAQAQVEGLSVATPDRAFSAYNVPLFW